MADTQKTVNLHDLSDFDENGILRPEKLGMVHVTDFMPQKVGDHWEIQSTAEATDYLYPRNTIHFTVGHHVASHMWGNWDNRGVMIVAPLKGMIDNNDVPLGMSAMDTWFETSPGKNLHLPRGTHLFMAAKPDDKFEGLTKTDGDVTIYKTSGFTSAEKHTLYQKMAEDSLGNSRNVYGDDPNVTISEAEVDDLPDSFFAGNIKSILLEDYLNKTGYCSDDEYRFSCGTADKLISELGEHLGCRFFGCDNKMHSSRDLTPDIVGDLFGRLRRADFLLHSDEFKIIKKINVGSNYTRYTFARPGKTASNQCIDVIPDELDRGRIDHESIVNFLKNAPDYTDELDAEEARGMTEDKEWTPAFRDTFHIWKEKTLARLSQYYTEAKNFDFDAGFKKLSQRIADFEENSKKHSMRTILENKATSKPTPSITLRSSERGG